MSQKFQYFVVLAAMRTGSNLLQSKLNAYKRIQCYGELFNPAFVNTPKSDSHLGITKSERDLAPLGLIDRLKESSLQLPGFRLFAGHNELVWDHVIQDHSCAKIVLTRNPLDSWVSLQIAKSTDQWRIGNISRRKSSKVSFIATDFKSYLEESERRQTEILRAMQISGQSAYYIRYDDLGDVEIINGLASWLGAEERIKEFHQEIVKQNPEPISEKVDNYSEVLEGISDIPLTRFMQTPNSDAVRGRFLPGIVTACNAPIAYLNLDRSPRQSVLKWLADLDSVDLASLRRDYDEGRFSSWRKANPGFLSFTVVRDPLARVFSAFLDFMSPDPLLCPWNDFTRHIDTIEIESREAFENERLRNNFKSFLRRVGDVLSGKSGRRKYDGIVEQVLILERYADVIMPDRIIREEELAVELQGVASRLCLYDPPPFVSLFDEANGLISIVDQEILALVKEIYAIDYDRLGYNV